MSSRCTSSPVGKENILYFTTSYFACLAQVSPLNTIFGWHDCFQKSKVALTEKLVYSHMINDFKTTFNPLWTGYGWGAATREPRARAELKYSALLRSVSSIWKAGAWTQELNVCRIFKCLPSILQCYQNLPQQFVNLLL